MERVRHRKLLLRISELEERCRQLEKNQKSPHDPLTGTLTKEHFREAVEKLLSIRHRRAAEEEEVDHLALVMIDLDYFKLVNDTYGHAAGDEVLRIFGLIAQGHLREHDMVCRWYQGDEFMILLRGVDGKTVPTVIEKLRKEFEEAEFSFHDDTSDVPLVRPSFSFGYVLHRAVESLDEMVVRADHYLYESKRERQALRR